MKTSELRQIIREEITKVLNENLKFKNVEKNRTYTAALNFGIFKKGDKVHVDTVRNLGIEVVLELTNNKGKSDSIKGDLEEEVEVFA
jgi:predicted component of type VI protein secretion system